MAIQTVTNENLAEYVASRPKPAEISSAADVQKATTKPDDAKTDGPTPGNPVIKTGEEKLEGIAPDPGVQPTAEQQAKKPKPVQPRIDELIREKKELDEAFQDEYETRLRLEGELQALKSQQQPTKAEEKPRDDLGPEPMPESYTDQKKFLAEWGEWQRKKARAEFAAEQETQRRQERARELDAAMTQKVAKAMADFPDFQEVIDRADKRTRGDIPVHIKAAMYESDLGAHLAYHLAKNPDEEKRIFALPVAKALLELGKIEDKLTAKPQAKTDASVITPLPETKTTPAPIARLKESSGIVPTDLTQPMKFADYRRARLEQIRASGRRRH